MKINVVNNPKRAYFVPNIKTVLLDNAISLVLQSSPPVGPDEKHNAPEYFNRNPFKGF